MPQNPVYTSMDSKAGFPVQHLIEAFIHLRTVKMTFFWNLFTNRQ